MEKENSKKNKEKKNIKIVIGDNSNLNISDVGDCVNDFRSKCTDKSKIIIPKDKK